MCFSDLLVDLQKQGIDLSNQQVRWALRTGRVSQPKLDGGGRFVFGPEHVEQLRDYADTQARPRRKAA
jgi:hypothetical protein